MQWLTPMLGIYTAAVAVPLLLMLYFLKLKRQEQTVSSTFLWQRAVRDMQVNAPFQRLRRNLLLLLQLLALALVLLSLAGPVLSLQAPGARRTVLLIDHSASMNAGDGNAENSQTRLEAAKEQARTLIRSLLEGDRMGQRRTTHRIMVIAFARQAQVMCNFTADRRQLEAALAAIAPTDEEALLQEALVVARAFAQAPGEDTNNRSAEDPAQLVLFSDGGIRDLDEVTLSPGELRYQALGHEQDNLAITALQARRPYENPAEVQVFALLANYGAETRTLDVRVGLDNNVVAVRSLTLPGATANDPNAPVEPGTAALDMVLNAPDAGLLEVRHLAEDLLPADDVAWAVLQVPHVPRVLLVSHGNSVLETALKACTRGQVQIEDPNTFNQRDAVTWEAAPPFDIVVLDNVTISHCPRSRYLVFGKAPPITGVSAGPAVQDLLPVDWRSQHAVLRHVNLSSVFVSRTSQWQLPPAATVLAEFTQGPIVATLQREQRSFVWAGFDVLQSNWPFEPSFVMFCYNALDFLNQQGRAHSQTTLQPGDPLVLTGQPGEKAATVTVPSGQEHAVATDVGGTLRFPHTPRVGPYAVDLDEETRFLHVVNLLNERESQLRPVHDLQVGTQTVAATVTPIQRANIPLWPWLIAALLALVWGEWMVYNKRMRYR